MRSNEKDGMARMMITEMAGSPKDIRVATWPQYRGEVFLKADLRIYFNT